MGVPVSRFWETGWPGDLGCFVEIPVALWLGSGSCVRLDSRCLLMLRSA